MKSTFSKILILLSITLISCDSENNITGEWERIKGGYEGTIINVVKEKDFYVGRVTKKSDSTNIVEFEIGDVKWKDIEYIENGKYKFKDQTKGIFTLLDNLEYNEGYLEMNKDTIQVIHNINGEVGERQTWLKKK